MKQIPGYPQYQITEDGRVFHYKRGEKKPTITNMGYRAVCLTHPDPLHTPRQKLFIVARLVALTYLEPVPGKNIINHIDCNKLNDHVSNLEWVTQKENVNHAIERGMRKDFKPVVIDGIKYQSLKKASQEIGISYYKLLKDASDNHNSPLSTAPSSMM